MVVANPKDIPTIFQAFKQDKKYLGGGAGSGFKDSSVEHLEELSEDAERIGSINLIVKKEGENGSRLIGHNTDGIGYVKGLEKEFGKGIIYNKNILILGAGGVTSSVVYHLLQKDPKSLTILNRTVSKANKIAEHMKGFFPGLKENIKFGGEDKIGELLNRADMVINVSNKGTEGSLSKFSAFATASKESDENVPNKDNKFKEESEAEKNITQLSQDVIVSDINIRDGKTTTLRVAEAYGILKTQDGLPMVLHQAIPAFNHVHPNITSENELEKIMSEAIFN
jgi:shikimate dehydrogenase